MEDVWHRRPESLHLPGVAVGERHGASVLPRHGQVLESRHQVVADSHCGSVPSTHNDTVKYFREYLMLLI